MDIRAQILDKFKHSNKTLVNNWEDITRKDTNSNFEIVLIKTLYFDKAWG